MNKTCKHASWIMVLFRSAFHNLWVICGKESHTQRVQRGTTTASVHVPPVLSCRAPSPSEQSLEIPNIAMKHFALFLSSNPFQNKISLGVIKTKIAMFRLTWFTNCAAIWFLQIASKALKFFFFFFFFGDVVNLNLCRSTVMTSPSDYEGFLITFNI